MVDELVEVDEIVGVSCVNVRMIVVGLRVVPSLVGVMVITEMIGD